MRRKDTYLFQSGDTDRYKIGEGDTFTRLSACQTGNPENLSVVLMFPYGKPLEIYLHEVFKSQSRWVRGEWFIFPDRLTAMNLTCIESEKYRDLRDKNPSLKPEMLAKLAAKLAALSVAA